MKRVIYVAFGFVCLLVAPLSVKAQDYKGVFDVYYQSTVYPESFDQFVKDNQSLFNEQFSSCLDALVRTWLPRAQQEAAICDAYIDPQWRAKCTQEAQFIPLVTWSVSISSVLSGKNNWPDTLQGGAAIMLKQVLGPGAYVNYCNEMVPLIRTIFLCQ